MPLKAAGFFIFISHLKERLLPINPRKQSNPRPRTSKSLHNSTSIVDKSLTSAMNANYRLSQHSVRHIPTINTIQQTNFTLSSLSFSDRRLERSLNSLKALMDEGKQQSMLLWLGYLFVDVLLFIFEVVYGVVQPMVYLLWVTLMRALLVITFNFIFFGGIYLLMVY